MRKYKRLESVFFSLFFIFLFSPVVWAAEMNLPYLKCEITLSKNKIVAGEPINLCFAFTNTGDGEVSVTMDDLYNKWNPDKQEGRRDETLKISIRNDEDTEVSRREILCRPASQAWIPTNRLKPGDTTIVEYPLHLRISTMLDPGLYHVIVTSFAVNHGYVVPIGQLKSISPEGKVEYKFRRKNVGVVDPTKVEPGVKVGDTVRESFSGPSLVLEVEPYDEAKLSACYENLMKSALAALTIPVTMHPSVDFGIPAPIRTLLWAEGPMAVPYQIEIMYDSQRGFRYWPPAIANTWDNIVRYAPPEQIERIIDIARHPECRPDPQSGWPSRYTPGIAWAIHQWHNHGSEFIKQITKDEAEILPEDEACSEDIEQGKGLYFH